ncbi:hypothetical protein S245_071323, partial [Arachis hypogaea]
GDSQMDALIWYSWLGGIIIGTMIGANMVLEEHCHAGPHNVVITGRFEATKHYLYPKDKAYHIREIRQKYDMVTYLLEYIDYPDQIPFGEGMSDVASSRDLRLSLDWCPEKGWTVPMPTALAYFCEVLMSIGGVLPEPMKYTARTGENSPRSSGTSLLRTLRIQSLGKLNPIDLKRLSFHMSPPHKATQNKKINEELDREMEVDHKDGKAEKDDALES